MPSFLNAYKSTYFTGSYDDSVLGEEGLFHNIWKYCALVAHDIVRCRT